MGTESVLLAVRKYLEEIDKINKELAARSATESYKQREYHSRIGFYVLAANLAMDNLIEEQN